MNQNEMNSIIAFAAEQGASNTGVINVADITFDAGLRKSCEMNYCGKFKRNWMCPPYCGEIDGCIEKAKAYEKAIVIQYIGELEDSYDFEGMEEAGAVFKKIFDASVAYAKGYDQKIYPLGAGGCTICERCAILDDQPCRNPELACPSLESHGIFVSDLAAKSGMKYINGQNTVTYFGAILF